jgi:hypothetical protein
MSYRILSPYEITYHNTRNEIAILDHAQNDLLRRLSEVRARRQHGVAQLTKLVYDNTLISRLPNEVLAIIFEAGPEDAISVSHVNRRWRYIATRLPSLWRNIHFPDQSPDEIMMRLHRSQSLSLAITIVADSVVHDANYDLIFIPCLDMIIKHASRWHSFHASSTSHATMIDILEPLTKLSAPFLSHLSVRQADEDVDWDMDWATPLFDGGAPLLRSVKSKGIPITDCWFPGAAVVELDLDLDGISLDTMDSGVFTTMPNLRVLSLRGSFGWMSETDRNDPVILPLLEQLTCGYICGSLLEYVAMPALRRLRVKSDNNYPISEQLEAFPKMLARCPRILPKVDQLYFDVRTNYAADWIFVSMPNVSLVRFSRLLQGGCWELCNSFFQALIDVPSRWPRLKTIAFDVLPDQVFNSLRDFLFVRSSEEHQFTIYIDDNHIFRIFYHDLISADYLEWLQQHVKVESTSAFEGLDRTWHGMYHGSPRRSFVF